MIVASRNISGYLGSPHWKIVLIVCYNKKPSWRHRAEILRYSHAATIFPNYYCTLGTITMTRHYDNIIPHASKLV